MNWLRTPYPSIAGETPTATLAPFTDLATMSVRASSSFGRAMSVDDWDLIFRLLLTSTSLQELRLEMVMNLWDARVAIALAQYLGAATGASLRKFELETNSCHLREAAFVSLCDGVAGSQLRKLILGGQVVDQSYVETGAESLARAIAESPLEEVKIPSLLRSALLRTQPVRNLDFSFRNIANENYSTRMKINRQWKPLLRADVPLGLWPQILKKAAQETSHGPAGIMFYILREKPDLVGQMEG